MILSAKNRKSRILLLTAAILPLAAVTSLAASEPNKPKRKIASPRYHAIQMDENFPVEELDDLGFETHKIGAEQEAQETPSARERNAFFMHHGLAGYVQGWDEFDKDMLLLRLMKQPAAQVGGKYPAIPASVIAGAQAALVRAGMRK